MNSANEVSQSSRVPTGNQIQAFAAYSESGSKTSGRQHSNDIMPIWSAHDNDSHNYDFLYDPETIGSGSQRGSSAHKSSMGNALAIGHSLSPSVLPEAEEIQEISEADQSREEVVEVRRRRDNQNS